MAQTEDTPPETRRAEAASLAARIQSLLDAARSAVSAKGEIALADLVLTVTPDRVFTYEEETGEPLSDAAQALRSGSALAAVRVVEHFAGVPSEEAQRAILKVGISEGVDVAFRAVVACDPSGYERQVEALNRVATGPGGSDTSPGEADEQDPNE